MAIIKIASEKEMDGLAKRVAANLRGGEVLLLQGELGAGKTTFTRALARALGARGRVASPTFVLLRIYPVSGTEGRKSNARAQALCHIRYLVHVDAYRIKNADELKEVGLMDYIGRPDTVVVVEWGEKIKTLLKKGSYSVIKFEHGKQEGERIIKV